MPGILYIVGTPIGNLNDLSSRAQGILNDVDIVACEDTRVTRKLLERFDIDVRVKSIHQHSSDKDLVEIINLIKQGSDIAFVSDAGTPGISDPGSKLVSLALKSDFEIIPIPGPSAVITALSVSGFPADAFTFLGFPPHKKGRKSFFEKLDNIKNTIVLYESKHRIIKTLESLPKDRLTMVARELTKIHETLYRGLTTEIINQINKTSDKGEFTIVIAPKKYE